MAKTRQLLLLRHAKSSWDDPSAADFDRPLSPRGQKTAPRVGAEIERRGWLPDLALVSPAVRTRQTWNLVCARWPRPLPQVAAAEELYGATPQDLLGAAQGTPKTVGTLLMLGHNPGLEEFARKLAGPSSDARALRQLTEKFPTAALARLEIEGDWDELDFGAARLTHCLRPRDLG